MPSVVSYDPAFGYEVALIVREGIRRMYTCGESIIYYLSVYNENYTMPAVPAGVEHGVLKGIYKFGDSTMAAPLLGRVQLLGSGALMQQVLVAQRLLKTVGVAADIWSVTSYPELYRDAIAAEEQSRQSEGSPRTAYVSEALAGVEGPFVAVTDYMRSLPESISKWIPGRLISLGTDGFGLSESRPSLRAHFQVDALHIARAAVVAIRQDERITVAQEAQAIAALMANADS